MKNLFKFMMPVAIATMALVSCNKEVDSAKPATGETLRINVTAVADDLLGPDGTRTYIGTYNDTPNTIIWGENESMKIAVLGDGDAEKASYGYSTTSDYAGKAEATFGFEITPAEGKTGDTYTYVGLYPASASVDNSSITAHKVELKSTQDATADSYDPKSYILIAMHEDGKTTSDADWTASYRRATALNKITLKGLAEDIVSVKITLPENAKFAGRRTFNLLTDEFGEVYSASNTIEVSYATPLTGTDIDGVNNKVVWFNSWGVSLAEGEEMTIVAKSATKSYTKTIAARSGGISFKQGYLNTLGVNMSGISGEEMAYDGCYAELLYEDVSDQLSNSYGLAEVTKNYGDNWKMFAVSSNGAIGVRRNDKPSSGTLQNDSYIKLPDFSDNINSVVVTLKNVTEGKTITLENSATATGGTIASLPTTSATVYTFNLTGDIKTAYFRSTGVQAQVEKVEVIAGTDTRTAIAAPTNVTATLNSSEVNAIDVSWGSVDGAVSYIVTLTPDTGNDIVVKAASSPYTVTDLAYEMDYLVSVQAEPADYYINKISAMTTFADVVTTGAAATGVVNLTESEIKAGSNTVMGTNNGKLAYRLGTSSNDGSLTFDAGYESITFTLAGWASGTRAFTIKNGKINGQNSLSPAAGSPSGTINANFNTTYSGTEYTIVVDDPTQEVVFSGRRAVVWGFTAVEAAPDTRTDVTLSFAKDEYEFVVNSTEYNAFTPQAATADPNVAAITNAITYALSDPSGVVTGFSTSTGAFTLTGNAGTATITASYPGDANNYKPAEASYSVKVNPNVNYVTFDFTSIKETVTNGWNGDHTVSPITINASKANTNKDGQVRFQSGGTVTFTGATITRIEINNVSGYAGGFTANVGDYSLSESTGIWTGSATSVVLTNEGNAGTRTTSIVVYYE